MTLTPVLTDAESRRTQIHAKALEALRLAFPLPLRDKQIEISDLKVHQKDFGPQDQKHALLSGGSLFEPVKATVTLRTADGKELEKIKNYPLLNLPYFTGRHTFVIDGNEYNVSNQLRLKPGVYTRRRGNEELEAAFNLSKGANFRLSLDPVQGHPYIEYGTTAIPLYSILRKLGVPHGDIATAWGSSIAEQNEKTFAGKQDKHLAKLYEKLTHPAKRTATLPETQLEAVKAAYANTSMDPEVTKETLGQAFASVTPQALLTASKRLLSVYRDNADTDDRDALRFKTYHSVDDFIKERITLDARALAAKVKGRATHKTELRTILPASPFSAGIRSFLTGSQLSSIPTHINPMEAIDHAVRVTSLGEGGIANERAIPPEARTVHSSHLGILDPIRTSESFRAGIDIRTALMAHRDEAGNLYTGVKDVKSGKYVMLSAAQMAAAVVAFPKQKLVGQVAVMDKGELAHVPAAKVTHELYDAAQLYSPVTNMVPFLESMQGNRGIMGGKMQAQALPLIHREVPLVQSAANMLTEHGVRHSSWEKEFAALALPTATVAGKVVKIDGQYIYIDPSGKKHAEEMHGEEETFFSKRAAAVKRQKTIRNICFKLELEPGDTRSGVSPEGKKWEKKMSLAYGHIPKTVGDDGETVDIYLKEDGVFENIYVVHQRKKDGSHDEDKCMVGFTSKEEAKDAYEKHGPEWGYGSLTEYTWDDFQNDYLSEHQREKAAAENVNERALIRIPYDTNFPFAAKTHLTHDLLVKPGDHVEADQHLAESNYTRNGTFALGRNMTVGYIPYYGMNSNDAVVISEGAAEKLTSEHMYKEILDVERDAVVGRDVHRTYYGTKYTQDQYRRLDANGVVKKGTRVMPHDILIAGVTKGKLSASDALLGNLRKTLVHPYRELVRAWEHDYPGEVIDVYATDKRVVVTVKTEEPMRVGDKLCFDAETEVLTTVGWVPVPKVTLQHQVCTLQQDAIVYQCPEALHAYPQGGRMYSMQSQQVDFLVTEKHKQYAKLCDAKDFALIDATTVFGKRVRYKKDGVWAGTSPAQIVLPAMRVLAGQGGNGERDLPERTIPVKVYMALLGAFLSNGNIFDQPGGNYGIDICKAVGPAFDKLTDMLTSAGINHTVAPSGPNCNRARIYSKQYLEHFRPFGHAADKYIPPEIFDFSREDLCVLFEWLIWGDGYTKEGRPVSYISVSKQLADDVQRLCLHIGIAANVRVLQEAGWQVIQGKTCWCQTAYRVGIVTTKLHPQVNHGHVCTQKVQREAFIENYTQPVYCVTVPGHVLYVRRNGKPAWSGNSGRHGNKGVVSLIVPDHKMLQDEKGKPLEVLYTSAGVISRINPAQILETCVAKVAKKIGKPIAVENFSGRDNVQWTKDLMQEHGVKDKETLFDPVSGKKIPGILVGPQYVLRLFKTTETNFAARGTGAYDVNQQPIKGGEEGAKAVGKMEFNALVAHNARNVLRETTAIKSQKNDEFWRAVQLGLPLPPLKTTFAYDKFVNMLHGAGVKVDTRGSISTLSPLTDRDILKMSAGAVQNEKLVRAKDLAAERGGLFDPAVTGGTQGTKWSHIELAEPVINPIFADPARRLLGLTAKEFDKYHYENGGAALKKRLNAVDVVARMKEVRASIKQLNGAKLDDAVKLLKFLSALHRQDLRPGDAYVLSKLPVLPPIMRPVLPGKSGSELVVGDSNYLYQSAMLHNRSLQRQVESPVLPPDEHAQLRRNLFNAVGAVVGTHESDNPKLQKRNVKGFLEHLTGKTTPKSSFFQQKLMKRQQDVSGRGTIAPDGSLGMDEVGLPIDMLWGMYGKFVIARLVRRGFGAVAAKEMLEKRHPAANDALMAELKERPVMLNRAPTLHRYGFLGAHPVPVAGKTIRVNAFIEQGTNSDYDGNCFIGSTKVVLTLEGSACKALPGTHAEEMTMKFGAETAVRWTSGTQALVEAELQGIPHDAEPYSVDKNGARSYSVPAGLAVLSYSPATGKPVMAQVTGLTIEDGCEVAEVEMRRGLKVTASTNESLCIYNHTTGTVEAVSPKDAVGRLSPVIRHLPLAGTYGDFEFGWMVGSYISDGFLMGDRDHYFGYAKVNDAHRERFAAAVNVFEGKLVKRNTYREVHDAADSIAGQSTKDHFSGAPKCVEFFKTCYVEDRVPGRACLSKQVPAFGDWSEEARWGLLVGMLNGDGTLTVSTGKVKPQVMAALHTSSVALVESLRFLLQNLGVRCSVSETQPKEGRLQKVASYTIPVSTPDLQRNLTWLRRGTWSNSKSLEALDIFAGAELGDQFDVVPVPTDILHIASSLTGPCAANRSLCVSLTTTKAKRKTASYITRQSALQILTYLRKANTPGTEAWAPVVENIGITWDLVESVNVLGKKTVYDLIVPETQVFAVNDGLIVWDTFQVHVPVLQPAIDEVKGMTLSNLLFSDREKNSLMVSPRMEALLGVHLASKAQASTNAKTHHFKTRADAYAAYKRGEITLSTNVEVP